MKPQPPVNRIFIVEWQNPGTVAEGYAVGRGKLEEMSVPGASASQTGQEVLIDPQPRAFGASTGEFVPHES